MLVGMSLRDWWRCKKEDWEHESSSYISHAKGCFYALAWRPQVLEIKMMMMAMVNAHFLAGHNKALFSNAILPNIQMDPVNKPPFLRLGHNKMLV